MINELILAAKNAKGAKDAEYRYQYDGYLQIANFEEPATNSQLTTYNSQLFIWDPTETVRTRPLNFSVGSNETYYVHDGNENVSEVLSLDGKVKAHYNYSPFGVLDISNSYEDSNENA